MTRIVRLRKVPGLSEAVVWETTPKKTKTKTPKKKKVFLFFSSDTSSLFSAPHLALTGYQRVSLTGCERDSHGRPERRSCGLPAAGRPCVRAQGMAFLGGLLGCFIPSLGQKLSYSGMFSLSSLLSRPICSSSFPLSVLVVK